MVTKEQALAEIRRESINPKEIICENCKGDGWVFKKFVGVQTCKVCGGNKTIVKKDKLQIKPLENLKD